VTRQIRGAVPRNVALIVIAKRAVLERPFATLIAELKEALVALPRRAV